MRKDFCLIGLTSAGNKGMYQKLGKAWILLASESLFECDGDREIMSPLRGSTCRSGRACYNNVTPSGFDV